MVTAIRRSTTGGTLHRCAARREHTRVMSVVSAATHRDHGTAETVEQISRNRTVQHVIEVGDAADITPNLDAQRRRGSQTRFMRPLDGPLTRRLVYAAGGLPQLVASIAALALVLLTAATAHAAPLPGSMFEGDDGNQANDGGVDWQKFQDLRRVVHSPNTDKLVIHGNEKVPGSWEIERGAGDVEIADAWSAIDQVAGQTFLYLAFARSKTTGTTHVTFELNQDSRLWDNGKSDIPIPCRRNGDVRVTFDYQGNTFQGVQLQRWRTEETGGEATTDPQTGCAIAGSFEPQPSGPDKPAQGAVNKLEITNYLGGTYEGKKIPRTDSGRRRSTLARS
jgi:hypothetical protein